MRRSFLATGALLVICVGLTLGLTEDQGQPPATRPGPARSVRLLPGLQPGGAVQLSNQWSLRPAGRQVVLGDFPVNIAVHPSGKWLAILHAGYGDHEIIVVDTATQRKTTRVLLDQTFHGLAFSPDGKQLYASGGEFEVVHRFDFGEGLLSNRRKIRVAKESETFIPGGLALDSKGKNLFVCGTWGHAVALVPLDNPAKAVKVATGEKSHPYACLPHPDGKRLFVSLWARESVAVIDLAAQRVTGTWETEKHPTEMVLSPDGKTLYVACANSTKVSVLDAGTGKAVQTVAASLYPSAPAGNTPNALGMTPDGKLLFVANADNNNVAVFNVEERGKARPQGFIPVGWYPTSVRCSRDGKRLYVTNGKGVVPKANRHGPSPYTGGQPLREYIAGLFQGTLGIIEVPGPDKMAAYSKQAYACSPLRRDLGVTAERPGGNPIPAKPGQGSPIKHCVYIIKENRTYDQVFGDITEGNGDPALCIFPEKVTPNLHKLVREFVLLDNFYVESEVSADGHEWSMGAYCTDYVEKYWPLSYRGSPKKKLGYPSEGAQDYVARPAGGYLWDQCQKAKVSYYSFGEWIANGKKPGDPSKARVKALEGHFDPLFRGYDLDYPDVKRADRFIEKLKEFEKKGEMPGLIILRLPNDHTSGTRAGKPTPMALVADNDQGVGMVVEALSKSKFWKELTIFVVEDDAQNGPDHVDAHRTEALVISPYTKRHFVDSTMYSTSSMLRTMELILGLAPMSQFDAAARPMYQSFQGKPDLTPYRRVKPGVDLDAKNPKTAWGAELSEKMNLAREDAADDLLFNEIIWRSVKGAKSPMPAPVRAAFVFPHLGKEKDADDD
jgi:YVTN family beta-propeller protein